MVFQKKVKKKIYIFLYFSLFGENGHGIGKKLAFLIGNEAEIGPLGWAENPLQLKHLYNVLVEK